MRKCRFAVALSKDTRTLLRLFAVVFVLAIAMMSMSREVLIPLMSNSAVDGDIAGDPQYYRSLALKKSIEIRQSGFGQFELRPQGQGSAGVASLFFLVSNSPYGYVALNGVLHAVSVVALASILMRWFPRRVSILSTMPLMISPLMITWFSQINKDSYVTAGALLFILGLLKLINLKSSSAWRSGLTAFLVVLAGMVLIWVVRPYVNQILLPITALILATIFWLRVRRGVNKAELALFSVPAVAVITCLGLMGNGAASDATLEGLKDFEGLPVTMQIIHGTDSVWAKCFANIDKSHWQNSQSLPDSFNEKLKALMGQRCLTFTMLETQENSNTLRSIIDTDKLPANSWEALGYAPRAMLLGVFSPWPDRWDYVLRNGPSTFYTVAPVEAALLYIGLAALLHWGIRNQASDLLLTIAICVPVMTAYAMANPFLGALYRYRYPWWMLLVCMGVAALLTVFWHKGPESHRRGSNP